MGTSGLLLRSLSPGAVRSTTPRRGTAVARETSREPSGNETARGEFLMKLHLAEGAQRMGTTGRSRPSLHSFPARSARRRPHQRLTAHERPPDRRERVVRDRDGAVGHPGAPVVDEPQAQRVQYRPQQGFRRAEQVVKADDGMDVTRRSERGNRSRLRSSTT